MEDNLYTTQELALKTECGKEFDGLFKAIKLIRDEKHNFHVVYKTFSDEYIYSFCNPFQDTFSVNTYKLISEEEAKGIFLSRLSQENARELFNTAEASAVGFHS
ncbi:hypothetical protein [Pontibacter vulgaris]|uniref:hypothetical protein n=1 Tax=Pontibacter vulgaris TaxID=2905679 RepID=UPI001FA76D7E|nr:hypothetical protein [Pontibacter vulgaris]